MRDIMPTSDLSRMSMAMELQTPVSRVPATLPQLGTWLGDYIQKLDVGMLPIGCHARTKNSSHT
eukprot:4954652-Prorocentrum_lima.AAC.1